MNAWTAFVVTLIAGTLAIGLFWLGVYVLVQLFP